VDGIPLVVDLDGGRDDVLVGVDQRVHDRGEGGVVDSQGDGGNGSDGAGEGLEELALLNVEDAGIEGLALVVDLSNAHTVGEGRDVQHVEQGGLGGTDLGAGLNELQIGGDFNGTTGDLGGDTESLEERGLAGLHTSVSSGDEDIERSDGTGTGRGGDAVDENLLTGLLKVGVGEDETNVAWERIALVRRIMDRGACKLTLDVRKETLVLRGISDEALERTADHGVLAHQDNGITTESLTDLVHLLRRDIVDGDDEDGLVSLEKRLQLVEVDCLGC
jgi:hypothetical protein